MIPERDLATEVAEPKYAHFERERRWLVNKAARPDVAGLDCVLVEDRYFDATRLRLRRMTRSSEAWTSCKLTKKYECKDPAVRPIVTAYLNSKEYDLFHSLPGSDIAKRRYRLDLDGQIWSLDIFEGNLAGLETVEAEVSDDQKLAALAPPPWAEREITHQAHYQCGALAHSQKIPED